jgi:hypothetical protein
MTPPISLNQCEALSTRSKRAWAANKSSGEQLWAKRIFKTPRTIDSMVPVPDQTSAIAVEGGAASECSISSNQSFLSFEKGFVTTDIRQELSNVAMGVPILPRSSWLCAFGISVFAECSPFCG